MIMARRDRSPAAASGCSLVVALALLVCAAGGASAAGQAGRMPQPARGGAEQRVRGGSAGKEGGGRRAAPVRDAGKQCGARRALRPRTRKRRRKWVSRRRSSERWAMLSMLCFLRDLRRRRLLRAGRAGPLRYRGLKCGVSQVCGAGCPTGWRQSPPCLHP